MPRKKISEKAMYAVGWGRADSFHVIGATPSLARAKKAFAEAEKDYPRRKILIIKVIKKPSR